MHLDGTETASSHETEEAQGEQRSHKGRDSARATAQALAATTTATTTNTTVVLGEGEGPQLPRPVQVPILKKVTAGVKDRVN